MANQYKDSKPIGAIICRKSGGEYRNYIKINVGTVNGLKNYIPYARYVIEKHIGRKLISDEIVHHINEIKTDDRIENLKIMSRSEHNRLHIKRKPPKGGIEAAAEYYRKRRASYYPTIKKCVELGWSERKIAKYLHISRKMLRRIKGEIYGKK